MNCTHRVFILSGPSGSGESTITNEIIKRNPLFARLITATTRPPRGSEQDGVDYFFYKKEEFETMIEKGDILEHTYIENRDVYYGTPKKDFKAKLKAGKIIIANVDIQGLNYFKKNCQALSIFIRPTSIDSLEKRLRSRGDIDSEAEIQHRIENAQKELNEDEDKYDYSIINADDKLDDAIAEVMRILQKEGYRLMTSSIAKTGERRLRNMEL